MPEIALTGGNQVPTLKALVETPCFAAGAPNGLPPATGKLAEGRIIEAEVCGGATPFTGKAAGPSAPEMPAGFRPDGFDWPRGEKFWAGEGFL